MATEPSQRFAWLQQKVFADAAREVPRLDWSQRRSLALLAHVHCGDKSRRRGPMSLHFSGALNRLNCRTCIGRLAASFRNSETSNGFPSTPSRFFFSAFVTTCTVACSQ